MVEIIHIIPDKSPEIEEHGVITQTEHQHDQDTAKYHGILFGLFWLALHISKKYWKSYRNNLSVPPVPHNRT